MSYRTGIYAVLEARPCIFQPGNCTGWGSERVNSTACWFAAWVSTLVLVTAMIPCILAGMLSDRFGIRRVAFTGGLLAFVGTLSSAFVKEVLLLYLTFGVLVGVGFSFTFSPSMTVLGHYFNKRLGLANGIMTCGGGVLSVGYVWILPVIYDHLGLRSTLLFMSGLSFLQIVYALTWIPTVHREKKPGDQQPELTTQRGENEQEEGVALNFTEDFGERNREQEDGGVALNFTEEFGERKREPPCQSTIQKGRSPSEREAATAQRGAHTRVDGGRSCCCCKTGDAGLLNVRIWKNRRYVLWIVSCAISGFGYFVVAFHNVSVVVRAFVPRTQNGVILCLWFCS